MICFAVRAPSVTHTQRLTHRHRNRHTHTDIETHIHKKRHTHRERETYTHTETHTHTHRDTHRFTQTPTQTHRHTHRETQTHTHTQTNTHTRTHTHTDTTHAHAHALTLTLHIRTQRNLPNTRSLDPVRMAMREKSTVRTNSYMLGFSTTRLYKAKMAKNLPTYGLHWTIESRQLKTA